MLPSPLDEFRLAVSYSSHWMTEYLSIHHRNIHVSALSGECRHADTIYLCVSCVSYLYMSWDQLVLSVAVPVHGWCIMHDGAAMQQQQQQPCFIRCIIIVFSSAHRYLWLAFYTERDIDEAVCIIEDSHSFFSCQRVTKLAASSPISVVGILGWVTHRVDWNQLWFCPNIHAHNS